MMQQGGAMPHEDTVRSMTLFAKEVMPRLKKRFSTTAVKAAE
jgi:hypothetical protein